MCKDRDTELLCNILRNISCVIIIIYGSYFFLFPSLFFFSSLSNYQIPPRVLCVCVDKRWKTRMRPFRSGACALVLINFVVLFFWRITFI